jgi:hypothetical protein
MPERRWRQVQVLDPAHQYEERDPTFRPHFTKAEGETDVRGWRPLAAVWKWAPSSESSTPWRSLLEQKEASSQDHADLTAAKARVEADLQEGA